MKAKPLAEQSFRLPGNKWIEVCGDRVQQPLTFRCQIDSEKDEPGCQAEWNSPQDRALRPAQEQEKENGNHRRVSQLLGVTGAQEEDHHARQPMISSFAVRFLALDGDSQKNDRQRFQHDHEHVLAKERPNMIDIV